MSGGQGPKGYGNLPPIGQRPITTGGALPPEAPAVRPPAPVPPAPEPSQRRWAAPRDAHVDVRVAGQWRQGLVIEQVHDGTQWQCHVAYLSPDREGIALLADWVPATSVRPRTAPPRDEEGRP